MHSESPFEHFWDTGQVIDALDCYGLISQGATIVTLLQFSGESKFDERNLSAFGRNPVVRLARHSGTEAEWPNCGLDSAWHRAGVSTKDLSETRDTQTLPNISRSGDAAELPELSNLHQRQVSHAARTSSLI
jgi:hypothetical protein